MFVVDTNILLYAVNPDSPDHVAARALVDRWRREDRSWFLTWGIIYEFLRVSTHGKVFPDPLDLPRAHAWIASLLASPSVSILPFTLNDLQLIANNHDFFLNTNEKYKPI